MRLTCPNCDAQYEVPDDVIPDAGRDVQCSDCGQTWFQHHPDHKPADQEAPDTGAKAPAAPPPPPPAPPKEPERKRLDPDVADILRQEAAAEQAARRDRQSTSLESQPDLGLDHGDQAEDAGKRAREARERLARMRDTEEPRANPAPPASRRDLLPDIEEINSTLRSGEKPAGKGTSAHTSAKDDASAKGGFRTGFLITLLVFVVLALLYIYAPQIARAAPQVDPYLSSYVGWVDSLRQWLDVQVQGALQWLDNKASQSAT